MWRGAALAIGLGLGLVGAVEAAPLGCPGGLIATHAASASTEAILPANVRSVVFQATQATGTIGVFTVEQCCGPSCGASGQWSGVVAALVSPTAPAVLQVVNPACLYRVTSTVVDGPVAMYFRCGAARR